MNVADSLKYQILTDEDLIRGKTIEEVKTRTKRKKQREQDLETLKRLKEQYE